MLNFKVSLSLQCLCMALNSVSVKCNFTCIIEANIMLPEGRKGKDIFKSLLFTRMSLLYVFKDLCQWTFVCFKQVMHFYTSL